MLNSGWREKRNARKPIPTGDASKFPSLQCSSRLHGAETRRADSCLGDPCRNGEGSWNYRLKFALEIPQKPEFLRLRFQLWDRDIFKWNDVIAEGSIDLYKWMMLAYHRKASVKPFKELKDARKKQKLREAGGAGFEPMEIELQEVGCV